MIDIYVYIIIILVDTMWIEVCNGSVPPSNYVEYGFKYAAERFMESAEMMSENYVRSMFHVFLALGLPV